MADSWALALLLAPAVPGQVPAELFVQPNAASVGVPELLQWSVFGTPNALYAVFGDGQPGPTPLLGVPLNLGLSANLITLDVGTMSPTGSATGQMPFQAPFALSGQPFYFQHLEVLGGRLRAGNPEGLGFESGRRPPIVENFRSRSWAGTFDTTVFYRLQGAPVRTRTQRTVDPAGIPFAQGIRNPLNTFGSRTQMVFRPIDVGATGEPELLTAVRWRPVGTVINQVYPGLDILVGHTNVLPNYAVDPFTGLPVAPNSGLDVAFAQNPAGPQTVLASGPYAVRAVDQTASGYMPYPMLAPFSYDGQSSLLLEFRNVPSLAPQGTGQAGRLMVGSSPDPSARVVAEGTAMQPLAPGTALTGSGDNFLYDYELDFTRIQSTAISPWYAGGPNPDYLRPVVCAQVPPGTAYWIEFRGANDSIGGGATAWGATQDIADGRPFLQMRVRFVGNARTGAVPFLDNLVIGVN